MYDPAADRRPRDVVEGVSMFFFYIGNNVSVAFRTFAGGILFGIGSLLVIFFNGLLIGGLAGHAVNAGFTETFYPFVIAHGSFELTAIVLAGVAGMRMGLALVRPGALSRRAMLSQATLRSVPILYGMTVMLIIAAAIEGLWSPAQAISTQTKYAVGAALWTLVIAWLALGGRGRAAPGAGVSAAADARVALRIRSGLEAVDLGFAMARAWWRPLAASWAVLVLPLGVGIIALLARSPGLVARCALVAAAGVRPRSAPRARAGAVRPQRERRRHGARAAAAAALGPRDLALRAPLPALAHVPPARAPARRLARPRAQRALRGARRARTRVRRSRSPSRSRT